MEKLYEVYMNELKIKRFQSSDGVKKIFSYKSVEPTALQSKMKNDLKSGLKWKAFILGLKAAAQVAKIAMSKGEQMCVSQHGPGKERCVHLANIKANQEKIAKLRSLQSTCSQSGDPEKCQHKIKISIRLAEMDIEEAQDKLREYKRKLAEEGLEVQQEIVPVLVAGGAKALIGMGAGIVVGQVIEKGLFAAWRMAQSMVDEASRKCGTFATGPKRDFCISKLRLASYQKKLQVLQNVLSTCPKQKNPEACRQKVSNEIEKMKEKIQIERDNVTLYNKAAVRAA